MEMFSAFLRHLSYSHCPQISSVRRENHCLTLSSRESSLLRTCAVLFFITGSFIPRSYLTRDQRAVLSASCGGCSSVFSPAVAALRSARARSSLRCRFQGDAQIPAGAHRSLRGECGWRARGGFVISPTCERSSSRYSRIVENKRDIQRDG